MIKMNFLSIKQRMAAKLNQYLTVGAKKNTVAKLPQAATSKQI